MKAILREILKQFVLIVKIFDFHKTLPANEAATSDHRIKFTDMDTDKILKPIGVQLISIDVNVVCVPASDIELGVK